MCSALSIFAILTAQFFQHADIIRRPPPRQCINFDRCNYGAIIQRGNTVAIEGEHWIAVGKIRADGKLKLLWINDHGRPAHALYSIDGDTISGEWGWHDEVTWLENGTLIGELKSDQIFKVVKP